MIVHTLTVGTLQTNCYVIEAPEEEVGAIIDPGAEAQRILDTAADLEIRYVINTHAHFDHTMGNAAVIEGLRARQRTPPQLVVHARAAPLLAANGGASVFGFQPVPSPPPDLLVAEGDTLSLGSVVLRVLHTPGHSPGSISLYDAEDGVVFVGDVLFWRGIGRADLPGGHWQTLLESIQTQLLILPDETRVYAGHGPSTTIGQERASNPYLRQL
ncbi:MAG: MBL fold metallo-hydrolase [Anaerolineae bacterium]|jgi:glyoxylase-like metal-dependent hydrolase (beta-lactamase superfamily II)